MATCPKCGSIDVLIDDRDLPELFKTQYKLEYCEIKMQLMDEFRKILKKFQIKNKLHPSFIVETEKSLSELIMFTNKLDESLSQKQ